MWATIVVIGSVVFLLIILHDAFEVMLLPRRVTHQNVKRICISSLRLLAFSRRRDLNPAHWRIRAASGACEKCASHPETSQGRKWVLKFKATFDEGIEPLSGS